MNQESNYIKFSCLRCRCEFTVLKNSLRFICTDCYDDIIDLDRMKMLLDGFRFKK